MAMLDEGTARRTSIQISDQLAQLGANLATGSRLDVSSVSLEALTENLDASLDIYGDVILHPSFPRTDFERLKKQRLAQIQQEKADPVGLALRVFPGLLYGPGHAYANPWTGSGTEESTARIQRDDLVRFHQTWFKPNHATLVVVGATTMAEIKPKLERLFAAWKPGDVPTKNIATVGQQPRPVVYLIDRPGSLQSVIIAGHVAPPKANPKEVSIETMNGVLGGDFSSRVNMNLREDKHWSYGAYTFFRDARGPASVRGLRAGADRQDQGGGGRAGQGAPRHREGPADPAGRALPGPGIADAHAAGIVGDRVRAWRDRSGTS